MKLGIITSQDLADFILTTLDQLKPTGYHRRGKKEKEKSLLQHFTHPNK
jgi:hypothetical protein